MRLFSCLPLFLGILMCVSMVMSSRLFFPCTRAWTRTRRIWCSLQKKREIPAAWRKCRTTFCRGKKSYNRGSAHPVIYTEHSFQGGRQKVRGHTYGPLSFFPPTNPHGPLTSRGDQHHPCRGSVRGMGGPLPRLFVNCCYKQRAPGSTQYRGRSGQREADRERPTGSGGSLCTFSMPLPGSPPPGFSRKEPREQDTTEGRWNPAGPPAGEGEREDRKQGLWCALVSFTMG